MIPEFHKKFFHLFLLFFLITSCGGKDDQKIKKPEKVPPLNILYKVAFNRFERGEYEKSVELFQKVETKYSFSEWAPRATLMVMYIYYESGESFKALEYASKFKKLYPRSKNIDYVDYIVALTFYEEINIVSRDQTNTKAALKEFEKLIKKYPNSIYANDAKYKIDLINEQLAGKEMYIARFYMKKSKWISALKRLKIIIDRYQTTPYSKEALHRLVEVYYNLGNTKEAQKYAAILGYNYNESDWYKKTYKLVKDRNYKIINEEKKIKFRDRVINLLKFKKKEKEDDKKLDERRLKDQIKDFFKFSK